MLLIHLQPLSRRTFTSLPKTSLIRPTSTIHRQTAAMSSKPGEQFEVRQTSTTEDYTPDPSKSLPLSPERQALVDDILALYSCQPTIRRVERYTADCVYDDQFVYANDRYKMAGQWFALPKFFKESKNERYEIIKNDRDLIQFKNEQVCNKSFFRPRTMLTQAVMDIQAHSQDRYHQRYRLPISRPRHSRLGLHSSQVPQGSGQRQGLFS